MTREHRRLMPAEVKAKIARELVDIYEGAPWMLRHAAGLPLDSASGQPLGLDRSATNTPEGSPIMDTITTELTARETEAAELIKTTIATHGRGTLSCDCGAWETYIDADAVGCYADTRKAHDMIEHARYDHVGPRAILFTAPVVVMELAR